METYDGNNIPDHLRLEPIEPAQAMGFALWPDNPNWCLQFLRQVGQCYRRGADFHEIYLAIKDVAAGDEDGWYRALQRLAQRLERDADRSRAGGHTTSAAARYLRASNYYRAAGFFLPATQELGAQAVGDRRRCFSLYAELGDAAIVPVEIPYENGATLPGFFFNPDPHYGAGPHPTVIMMGGGDTVAEEMYLDVGQALSERGYKCLSFDGPGQGESIRRGLYARHDWEVVIGRCIDFLLQHDDVDPENIGIVSVSLGSYYAPRAAAFEKRLKALCVWGGLYRFPDVVLDETADWAEQLKAIFGVGTVAEVAEKVKLFALAGVADKIACPTLYIVGEGETAFLYKSADRYVPNDHYADARRAYLEIPHENKRLIVFRIGEPGMDHCSGDARAFAAEEICDWFDQILQK